MSLDMAVATTHFDDLLTIAEIARNLNDFRPLDDTMELICERVAGMPACDWVTISLVSETGDSTKSWGDRHIKPEFMSWARSQNRVEKSLKSPVFHAIASGRPVLISDVLERSDLPTLRAGASVQGIRAMAYLPIMTRGRALGTMNCYTSSPHAHTEGEIDLLQTVARLAGVAAETAIIADRQRTTSERLQKLTRELSDRNQELSALSEAQVRLTEEMTETPGDKVQQVVEGLAADTGSAVMVVTADGRVRASSGQEDGLRAISATLEKRDFAKLPQHNQLLTLDECTVIRIGPSRTLGLLLVHPRPPKGDQTSLVLLRHSAAILAFEFEVENSDRTLRDLARPNALLAVARGQLTPEQCQAMASVLVAAGEPIRMLVTELGDSARASRVADILNRTPRSWDHLASVAEGTQVLSLLLDRAAGSIEERLRAVLDERQLGPWQAGLSGMFRDVADLRKALDEADSALRIAGPDGRLVRFEELGPAADLLESMGRERAARFVLDTIGPIIEYDRKRSTDLLPSLATYLRLRGSLRQAAAELRVHPNTLQQRLARVGQLANVDLHDPEQLGFVAMALAWQRLV